MKAHFWLMCLSMAAMTLSACSEGINSDPANDNNDDRKNEYTKAWIKTFGLIPAKQDWCMLEAITANVSTDGLETGATTKIYSADPDEGGRLKAVITDGGSVRLDVTEGTTDLYAEIYNAEGCVVAQGICFIEEGIAAVTPTSLSTKRMSRHEDNPFIEVPVELDAVIVCEDMGSIGDFDFNDIVLGLQTVKEGGTTTLIITPLAAGGMFEANILFGRDDKGEIHQLMADGGVKPEGAFYNTVNFDSKGSEITIDNLDSDWTIADNWENIKFKIQGANDAYEISKVPSGSAPQIMCLSGDFYWPQETVSIKTAYPDFQYWATGNYDDISWIDSKIAAKIVSWAITKEERQNYFIATTTDGSDYTFNGGSVASGAECHIDVPISCENWFDSKSTLVSIDLNGSHFDSSNVNVMTNMFRYCSSLTSLDLSNFNTASVTNMASMFNSCRSLSSLDVSNFNTASVTNMASLFYSCSGLSSLDVSNFNTASVTNMAYMFYGCSGLSSLDLRNFNTSSVTTMEKTFSYCSGLTSLDLTNFNTANVTTMEQMFYNCSGLTSLNVSNFNTARLRNMASMFSGCKGLSSLNVSSFDTSNVTTMNSTFGNCSGLSSLDLRNFITSRVTSMTTMFSGCKGLSSLNVSSFDTSSVKYMGSMFASCSGLSRLDVSNFVTSNVTQMCYMFKECSGLSSLDLSNFNTSKVTDMDGMFDSCSGLISLDLRNFNTANVTKMSDMFKNCSKLKYLYLNNFEISDSAKFNNMFSGCSSQLEIWCTAAFRTWCINNQSTNGLPIHLRSASNSKWHIVG